MRASARRCGPRLSWHRLVSVTRCSCENDGNDTNEQRHRLPRVCCGVEEYVCEPVCEAIERMPRRVAAQVMERALGGGEDEAQPRERLGRLECSEAYLRSHAERR